MTAYLAPFDGIALHIPSHTDRAVFWQTFAAMVGDGRLPVDADLRDCGGGWIATTLWLSQARLVADASGLRFGAAQEAVPA